MKKHLTLFILILAIFSISHEASAKTYEHRCTGGGTVVSDVSITPKGPFSTKKSVNFQAKGWIKSDCSARKMKMTLKHNEGTELTIIEEDTVGPTDQYPELIPSKNFQSPTVAGKGYKVSFKTSVEEPVEVSQNYSYQAGWRLEGRCTLLPSLPVLARRDQQTLENAKARGVTSVKVTFPVTTDNSQYDPLQFRTTNLVAVFYPDDTEVSIQDFPGQIDHSDGAACSQIVTGDRYDLIKIEEQF